MVFVFSFDSKRRHVHFFFVHKQAHGAKAGEYKIRIWDYPFHFIRRGVRNEIVIDVGPREKNVATSSTNYIEFFLV